MLRCPCEMQERAVTGVLRCPEALGIDTSLLAARATFLQEGLGMSPHEVRAPGGGGQGVGVRE